MRKHLLFSVFATAVLFAGAQQAHRDNSLQRMQIEKSAMVAQQNHHVSTAQHQHRSQRALSSILHSQRIGSAGNLLTIIEGACNQIDANEALNTVTFIHRNDETQFPGTNRSHYRMDISKDRGNNWTPNEGPLNNDPLIDNISVNGRFPQAVIYNPTGNSVADSAYLVYSGTWHNSSGSSGSWQGPMRGRGKLSGDTSTFNVAYPQINSGKVNIATGMCKGAPGVFWNVTEDYNGTFNTGWTDFTTHGIIVEKGVWNTVTKDVNWTQTTIPQTFVSFLDANSNTGSAATSFNIAFDPTGQYGWIACLGDINVDADSVYDPIFWKTVDGGNTWTGPIWVDLDSIQGVKDRLNPNTIISPFSATSMNPSTAFQADLTVDVNGNPHLLTTVGSGTEYAISAAGYTVWDITYDASAPQSCNWKGVYLADIFTFRGTFSSDASPNTQTEDNRPLISRTEDGHKIFFFWEESDHVFEATTGDASANDAPNLFGRGIDVVTGKMTQVYNFTEGDSLWGGTTSNTSGGAFGGATFPTVGQTCLVNGSNYNVPLVLTQIDYNFDLTTGLGSSQNPAAFWYINNINFPSADFIYNLDQVPPSITLNGPDTITILVNTSYTEQGATAFDCTDGVITPVILNSPDTAHTGIYNVLYIATDAAGNSDTVTRIVIVGAPPIADFTWGTPQLSYKVQFQDLSTNMPTSWQWNFGDGTGSTAQNPLKTFTSNGTKHVCLTVSNSFGTSTTVCKDVTVVGVGIQDLELAQHISMFPNPSNGKVFITIEGNVTPDMSISVYNVLGELVMNPVKYKAGTTNIEMDLASVASGVYLVKIQTEQGSVVKHLTISHK
jgi:PKD repeat protein